MRSQLPNKQSTIILLRTADDKTESKQAGGNKEPNF